MIFNYKLKNIFLIASVFAFAFFANHVFAANIGDTINFNIDKNFDASERSQVAGVLIKTTPNIYFYIEKNWWESQLLTRQQEIVTALQGVSLEFDNNIYPTLTSLLGSEWNPGVDGDTRVTIFLHAMKEGVGGYFRSADEYLKLQVPSSNEREMLYLPISQIENTKLKVFLAHEFTHLIIFNQKDRLRDVQEEVWLNEAVADFSSSIMGYDNVYEGSNLQRRVRDFLAKPSDALTEWPETKYDYAAVSVFMHYLVDHYGVTMLADSLKSKLVGIASINEALSKNGYKEDFSKIFTDWSVAIVVNDCKLDLRYCYLNKNLTTLRINPTLMFLPVSGNSSLSSANVTKNWAGNWQKIIGGNGDLKLEFSGSTGMDFKVPYLIFDDKNSYAVHFLTLDKNQKGEIDIKDFGGKYTALLIIPTLQTKLASFGPDESIHPYTLKISVNGGVPQEEDSLIAKLLEQIEALKKQIAQLQSASNPDINSCAGFSSNLYVGVANKAEVTCLQSFLKSQGVSIYPEGLVTGSFGSLTKAAVIRFQEKYRSDILTPGGLSVGTGYVGALTRAKLNQLLR